MKNKEKSDQNNVGRNRKIKKEVKKEWRRYLMILKPEIKKCHKIIDDVLEKVKKNKKLN